MEDTRSVRFEYHSVGPLGTSVTTDYRTGFEDLYGHAVIGQYPRRGRTRPTGADHRHTMRPHLCKKCIIVATSRSQTVCCTEMAAQRRRFRSNFGTRGTAPLRESGPPAARDGNKFMGSAPVGAYGLGGRDVGAGMASELPAL